MRINNTGFARNIPMNSKSNTVLLFHLLSANGTVLEWWQIRAVVPLKL